MNTHAEKDPADGHAWRTEARSSLSDIRKELEHIRNRMGTMNGSPTEWYRVTLALVIASDAIHLARDGFDQTD